MISRRDALRLRLAHGPPIVADGGMGSRLRQLGWIGRTEDANLAAPDVVEEIHRGFRQAGAEMILTNTFMLPFREPAEYDEIVAAAVARARAAANGGFVVGSLAMNPDWASTAVQACGRAFKRAQVDAVVFETMKRLTGPAVFRFQAFVAAYQGPILVSFLPAKGSRSPRPRGVAHGSGWNCGPPDDVLAAARRFRLGPGLSLRPSAGLPSGEGRGLTYPVTPAEFGAFAREALALGARVIGGCCGATPEHIAAIAREVAAAPAR